MDISRSNSGSTSSALDWKFCRFRVFLQTTHGIDGLLIKVLLIHVSQLKMNQYQIEIDKINTSCDHNLQVSTSLWGSKTPKIILKSCMFDLQTSLLQFTHSSGLKSIYKYIYNKVTNLRNKN